MKTKFFLVAVASLLFNVMIGQQTTHQTCGSVVDISDLGDFSNVFISSTTSASNSLSLVANSSYSGTKSNMTSIQQTKGSPYLASTFEKSDIYVGDQLLGTYYSRYNAYSKEIEIKKTNLEEEQYKALILDEKIRVVFVNKEIQYTSFIDKKGLKQNDYLISKTEGAKYRLYQRLSIRYDEGQEAQNSFVAAVPPKFSQFSEYYLKDLNSNLVSFVPTKKGKLLKLFKNNEQIQIASIIKNRGFNLKKEMDLVKLFDLANTLEPDLASAGN